MSDIKKVIEIGRELETLEEKYSRLAWTKYSTGFDFGLEVAYEKYVKVLKNKDYYNTILSHQKKSLKLFDKRRVDIIAHFFKPYHISEKLNQLDLKIQKKIHHLSTVLHQFRFKLNGREIGRTEIDQILASEPDRELRKKAYLALAQINQPMIEVGFIDLIRMRCQYANLYGAKNFVEYKLERDELTPSVFENWQEEICDLLPKLTKVKIRFGEKYINDAEIRPWDVSFIETQIAPQSNQFVDIAKYKEVLENIFGEFGFDISKSNITFDIFPRRNKSAWGCFPIKKGKDCRILLNITDRFKQFWVLLHETGHAVHYLRIDPEDILLNMGISRFISEGFANFWGNLIYEKVFYKRFFDDNIPGAEVAFENLKVWKSTDFIISLLHRIVFDRALYLKKINDLDDINTLYWDKYKSIHSLEPFTDNPPWAFLLHHTVFPISAYYYLLGDLFFDMLRSCFTKKTDTKDILEKPKKFGRFVLEKVIKPSGAYPYIELFERISGEPFSLKYLVESHGL